MILEFTCKGYHKKTHEETTYTLELQAESDYPEYFKSLLEKGELTASNVHHTLIIAIRELSWFKDIVFRNVTAINEKHSYTYLVMLEWSSKDDEGLDYYLYKNYDAAKQKYDRLIEDENDADISWIGSEVFDEDGEVNEGYKFDCSEETGSEQNLCWKVEDLKNSKADFEERLRKLL